MNCGVAETLHVLRTRGLDVTTLDLDVGLAMVRVRRPPRVEDKWSYLTVPSNRGQLIMEHLHPLLRPGDRIFEAYCGFSPLNDHYADASVFGFDIDPDIIARLRVAYPGQRWEQIDERQLAYADLPETADVLVGIGLTHGYCSWDAQMVEANLRFLVRHYRPRVCLFESAADYHDGEILHVARRLVEGVGYRCHEAVIETDMPSYHRRKLLLAVTA